MGDQCSPYQAVTNKIYRPQNQATASNISYRLQPLDGLLKL